MAKRVVIAFGRFNPPTTGHGALVQFVARTADKLGADAVIFPSQSQDASKNPLPFKEKVAFLRLFFGRLMNFSDAVEIRTPFHALEFLSHHYDEVYAVCGSDRVSEFQKFGNYVVPKGTRGKNLIPLAKYKVVPVPGERDPDADDVAGMSASKLRKLAVAGDYDAFRAGVPTQSDTAATRLYKSVRRHMGIRENTTIAIFGVTPRAAKPLREALTNAVDLTDKSMSEIRRFMRESANVRIYTRNEVPGALTEGLIQRQSTYGLLKREFTKSIVEVRSKDENVVRDVRRHMMEADGEYGKVKQPSEVDRLKDTQKQQTLSMKTRQSQELLQAQQRELQKKSREDQQKIVNGSKPKSITR